MKKYCLIQQPSGLGDIMLSIKIADLYTDNDYEVIWPVYPIYSNLNEKIIKKFINFVNIEDNFKFKNKYMHYCDMKMSEVYDDGEVLFVPIKNSFHSKWGRAMQKFDSHDASNMLAKFLMCGSTHQNWQEHFEIKRNHNREQKLIEELEISGDFHFVNKNFGTPPTWSETLDKKIETPKKLKRVEMKYLDGYDVFDWMGVYERATKIDTVSTSTFYFFEKQNLRCVPTIYSRNTSHRSYEENFGWLKKLAKKEYNFIC